MKTSRFIVMIAFLSAAAFWPRAGIAQSAKDSAAIASVKEMVSKQQYSFKAQTVTPLPGRLRQLTSDYDLQVSKETIVASLPYFGRAYSATPGSSGGGIQFTAKDFQYTSTEKKKGGWNIIIRFKDAGDTQQMQLSIFNNGTASLQVTSNNRQPISFNGYITAPVQKN
jgi:Domain of unknown function (DUF4251)